MVWFGNRQTVTTTTVDSFEDGGLTEYNAVSGSLSNWTAVDASTVTPDAIDGSYILRADQATSNEHILSSSGLDNYFPKGNISKFYFYNGGTSDSTDNDDIMRTYFGVGDETNRGNLYRIQVRFTGSNDLKLSKLDGFTVTDFDTTAVTVQGNINKWWTFKITWDDGTLGGSDNDITVEADPSIDPGAGNYNWSVSTNDSTFATDTGIGFRAQRPVSNTVMFWDYWHITT